MMEKKTLGAFIAQLRKEKGLTQKSLAELLNVSDKTVSHWECDENSPDISILPFISKVLGVSVDELLRAEIKQQTYTAPQFVAPVPIDKTPNNYRNYKNRQYNSCLNFGYVHYYGNRR